MIKQEIFDTVATHLFTQGKRAFDETEGLCAYLTSNGNKCAVGCLIPKEAYRESMEGNDVYALRAYLWERDIVIPAITSDNMDLLCSLQAVHDRVQNWETTEAMQTALEDVAIEFELSDTVLVGKTLPNR